VCAQRRAQRAPVVAALLRAARGAAAAAAARPALRAAAHAAARAGADGGSSVPMTPAAPPPPPREPPAEAPDDGAVAALPAGVRVHPHQVAGHRAEGTHSRSHAASARARALTRGSARVRVPRGAEGRTSALATSDGFFLKPLPADARGACELHFYQARPQNRAAATAACCCC
jgi:hypothetical protein